MDGAAAWWGSPAWTVTTRRKTKPPPHRDFQQGRWYRLWFAVQPDRIRAWIDDELVIDVVIANREVGLRLGEIELSKPFGIASYDTTAKVRNIEWRPLPTQ